MINLKTKIKAILFDIGGPIDSEILNDKLLKLHFIEEFSKYNITINDHEIENCLERLITNFDKNIYSSLCENFSNNNEHIQKSVYNNILLRSKERDLIIKAPEISDEVIGVLKQLSKDYKLGVVANQTLDALKLLKNTGINNRRKSKRNRYVAIENLFLEGAVTSHRLNNQKIAGKRTMASPTITL